MEFKVSEGVKGFEARVNSIILVLIFYVYFIFIGCYCAKSNR